MSTEMLKLITSLNEFEVNDKFRIVRTSKADLKWKKSKICPMKECRFPVKISSKSYTGRGFIIIQHHLDLKTSEFSAMLYEAPTKDEIASAHTIVSVSF